MERARVPRDGRGALADGYECDGTPIVPTEFGGISYSLGARRAGDRGYSGGGPTKEAFVSRLGGLEKAARENMATVGYC